MRWPTRLGSIADAAAAVHREFAQKLRFVRLWREGTDGEKSPPSGIKVDRDYVLVDEDIIELHVERSA